jgi:hypothetical protein
MASPYTLTASGFFGAILTTCAASPRAVANSAM